MLVAPASRFVLSVLNAGLSLNPSGLVPALLLVILENHELVAEFVIDLVGPFRVFRFFVRRSSPGHDVQESLMEIMNLGIDFSAWPPGLLRGGPEESLHVCSKGFFGS